MADSLLHLGDGGLLQVFSVFRYAPVAGVSRAPAERAENLSRTSSRQSSSCTVNSNWHSADGHVLSTYPSAGVQQSKSLSSSSISSMLGSRSRTVSPVSVLPWRPKLITSSVIGMLWLPPTQPYRSARTSPHTSSDRFHAGRHLFMQVVCCTASCSLLASLEGRRCYRLPLRTDTETHRSILQAPRGFEAAERTCGDDQVSPSPPSPSSSKSGSCRPKRILACSR